MQRFEVKIRFKLSLIVILILLIIQLVGLGISITKNLQIKQYGTIINDSYLYYNYKGDILNIIVLSIVFAIILFLKKNWKPKHIFIDDESLKFRSKKEEEIVIPFSDLKSVRFYSSKIITSKGTFSFPILRLNNLSDFLIELKSKLNKDFSAKELKQIDDRIVLDKYNQLKRKTIIPQILFLLIFLFVSIGIVQSHLDYIYHFSFVTKFMLIFSGILAEMFAEILRFVNFKKNFDIIKINEVNQESKTIWMLYGLFYLLWFIFIFITVLFYK